MNLIIGCFYRHYIMWYMYRVSSDKQCVYKSFPEYGFNLMSFNICV